MLDQKYLLVRVWIQVHDVELTSVPEMWGVSKSVIRKGNADKRPLSEENEYYGLLFSYSHLLITNTIISIKVIENNWTTFD